jgi:hypothetical protein
LEVTYDTLRKAPRNRSDFPFESISTPSFGSLWESNLHRRLVLRQDTGGVIRAVQAARGSNRWVSFMRGTNGLYTPDPDALERLVVTATGWRLTDAEGKSQESYDSNGRLNSIAYARTPQAAGWFSRTAMRQHRQPLRRAQTS